jgi:DNA-binding NarL/FixJ family response regulator
MEKQKIKVIIAEDHVVLRQGLRLLLEQDDELSVVGEANNGREVLDKLGEAHADVVLMDINMPVLNGYETTEQLRASFPETKVVALSMHSSLPYVQKIMACGAQGYLLKTSRQEEVLTALKLVANGTSYISGDLSVKLLEQKANKDASIETHPGGEKGLSKREVEVLGLVAEGYTNAQIADKLFTSKRTIETHRQNILEKTGARNTASLVKYAVENRIIGAAGPE